MLPNVARKTVLWNTLIVILIAIPVVAILWGIQSAFLVEVPAFTAYSLRCFQTATSCIQVYQQRQQLRWLVSTLSIVLLGIVGFLFAITAALGSADFPLVLVSVLVLPLVIVEALAVRSKREVRSA